VKPESPAIDGVVYGVVLNDHASIERMGAALDDAPYKGAPKAPVLYIKPSGTLVGSGTTVRLPQGATAVEIGATVGVVFAAGAARLAPDAVLAAIAGYVVVADLSLPHSSYYRPAIREKCFDGACPVGSELVAPAQVGALADVELRTFVNGELVQRRELADLVRDVPRLVADVSEFMTLRQGDALLVGVTWQAPQARPGDVVRVEAERIGAVEFQIAAGEGAA